MNAGSTDADNASGKPDYDVVIVGAGMVGCILAKHLTRAKRRVLLLEAGKADALTYHGYQSYVERSYVMPSRPNSPYPQNDAAGMPGIPYPESREKDPKAWFKAKDPEDNYWIQTGPVPFGSDYARALGGTSLHWLGIAMRHVPRDFELESRYRWGRDWPVEYRDVEPYYRRAEYELGVSADVHEQTYLETWFADGYVFPMQSFPMTYLDYTLNEDIKGMTFEEDGKAYAIEIVPVPQARNGMPDPDARRNSMTAMEGPLAWQAANPGMDDPPFVPVGNPSVRGVGLGDRCEGNSSCIPICPVQAKYNAGKSLAAADRDYLDFRSQCVATKVNKSRNGETITSLEYIRYGVSPESPHTRHTVTARIYVLAAHCVENAKICLVSDVANRSDQVGRNLMDHPYINFSGLYPKKIWGYRGPDVTGGMPLMRDGSFREKRAAFRTDIGNWGWVFPQGSPNSVVDDMVENQGLYGRALREALEDQGPRHMRIGYLIEQLPDPKNRVTLEDENGDQKLDSLGIPRPFVYYDVDDYTLAGMDAAQKLTDAIFEKAGIEARPQAPGSGSRTYTTPDGEKKTFQFFGSGHLIGTHIMGDDPDTSVVDSFQKAHDHDNLVLAVCGSHPTSATANPSLTMTALTFRTFDRIQEMLPSQEADHDQ